MLTMIPIFVQCIRCGNSQYDGITVNPMKVVFTVLNNKYRHQIEPQH